MAGFWWMVWLVGMWMAMSPTVQAQVSESIVGVGESNATGFVIDADANDPTIAPGRSVIEATAVLIVTYDSTSLPISDTYQADWSLIDAMGNQVPLVGDSGQTQVVSLTLSTQKPRIGRIVRLPLGQSLQPAAPLDPQQVYRVEVSVSRVSDFPPIKIGTVAESPGQPEFHFTNASSPDAGFNVLARLRATAVSSTPTGILLKVPTTAARYDDFTLPPSNADIAFTFNIVLHDVTAQVDVPLATSSFSVTETLSSYLLDASFPDGSPATIDFGLGTVLQPTSPLAYGHSYVATTTLQHIDGDGSVVSDGQISTPPTSLVQLTGNLFFGSIRTTFSQLANDPVVGAVALANGVVLTQLAVSGQSGGLPGQAGYSFGDGTPLLVRVLPGGDAYYIGPTLVVLNGGTNGRLSAGPVQYSFTRLQLDSSGLAAIGAQALLPPGEGIGLDGVSRQIYSSVKLGKIGLDQNLSPISSAFTVAASDLGASSLWFSDERLPLRLQTSAITWHVDQGTFELAPGLWHFTRETELAAIDASVAAVPILGYVNPASLGRLGNDHFLRGAQDTGGLPVRVAVDTNGLGLLDARISLRSGAFAAHFPAGTAISFTGGNLVLTAGQVDTMASHLDLPPGQKIRQLYAQGCGDGGCVGATVSEVLTFAATVDSLGFTSDGGLIADGTVATPTTASARVQWGALGSGAYAQSVGDFTAASLHVPGFSLQADASIASVGADDRSGALLYTGYAAP